MLRGQNWPNLHTDTGAVAEHGPPQSCSIACVHAINPHHDHARMQCFYCPVVRHMWWWLGGRPASAATMHALLSKGGCVLVCPGGVRECLHMEEGREAILLHGRTGFVRIAMQHGASSRYVTSCAVRVHAQIFAWEGRHA